LLFPELLGPTNTVTGETVSGVGAAPGILANFRSISEIMLHSHLRALVVG
jgi:hypothetical protein